jgi:hypothetical protein
MARKQIINPLVGFGQRSIGPYANRIGGSTYARHVALRGPVAQLHAYGADANGQLWGLEQGDGSLTFARATEASVTDAFGQVRTALVDELRFLYGRRVENLAAATATPATQDITVVSGKEYQVSIGAGSAGGATAVCSDAFTGTLTGDASNMQAFDTAKTASSTTLTVTITGAVTDLQVEDVTGQADQNPSNNVSAGVATGPEQVADAWTEAAPDYSEVEDSGTKIIWTRGVGTGDAFVALALADIGLTIVGGETYILSYNVTENDGVDGNNLFCSSTSSLAPSSAISTDLGVQTYALVASSNSNLMRWTALSSFEGKTLVLENISMRRAEHGVNVDGVAYFNYANGNTVSGNVVTEAKGDPLVGGVNAVGDWRALYESFATTNYSDGDDDLSGGAETVDLAASGTGDHTYSGSSDAVVTVAAGTATGTGFAQSSAGGAVTFNLTVAGTVTLTLNSGTLDKWDGLAQKQVEKASVASSWIPTSGGSANRSADVGAPSFAFSNFNQVQGSWIADVWFSALNLGVNQGIFSIENKAQNVLSEIGNEIESFDDTGGSAVALSPVALGNRFRVVSDFGTGDTLEVGMRDVDGAGSFAWDGTPANYSGAFATDSVINIAYGGTVPIGIRDLYGYTTRLGKAWVEKNY